jgi:hypothetical protein
MCKKYFFSLIFKASFIFLLVFSGCVLDLFKHKDPPVPPPEPFKAVKSKKEIMGEWVCYNTFLQWKDGHEYFHLDKYKEEDKIIIDTTKVNWRFKIGNDYIEYNFLYILDTTHDSWFCMDTVLDLVVPIHHWSGILGRLVPTSIDTFLEWVAIGRLNDTLQFDYDSWGDVYTYETAHYVKKTW